jgi:hypothetical protein
VRTTHNSYRSVGGYLPDTTKHRHKFARAELTVRGCIQKFPDWVDKRNIRLQKINTRWEATQRVTAAKLTRLTHKIAIQLHAVAESCTTCSSRSRRPVRKLLDTHLYVWGGGRGVAWFNVISVQTINHTTPNQYLQKIKQTWEGKTRKETNLVQQNYWQFLFHFMEMKPAQKKDRRKQVIMGGREMFQDCLLYARFCIKKHDYTTGNTDMSHNSLTN